MMVWKKIRSGGMFVVAFVGCPCHLPITLPLALALLTGTSAAVWIAQHTAWVYGGMTILFLISLALGFMWMSREDSTQLNYGVAQNQEG
jgi:hypothetical protein